MKLDCRRELSASEVLDDMAGEAEGSTDDRCDGVERYDMKAGGSWGQFRRSGLVPHDLERLAKPSCQ